MSLAEEPQLAVVHAAVKSALEEDDARRFELIEWMERNGHGSTPWRSIPAEVLERARRELGHAPPAPAPVVKTFTREAGAFTEEPEAFTAAAPHPVLEKRAEPTQATEMPPQTRAENQQPEEEQMAEKTCQRCKKPLRADNTTGVCGDRGACTKRLSDASPLSAKVTKIERSAARKPKGHEELALEIYELDELVELRSAVTAELRKRKEQAENELEKLREVVG